jgi:cobalt/nickel transport system permease protein
MLAPLTPVGRVGFADRLDPRSRILAVAAFSILVALCSRPAALLLALAAALAGVPLAGLRARSVLRRLLPINGLMLVLVLLLPWTTPGTPAFSVGSWTYTREGLLLAVAIALKGNAIMLAVLVHLGALETTTIGHALAHLRVPDKLTNLLLFTVRYLDVLHREHQRMRSAMRVRAFRPGMNMHTYRTYGHLAGMLLVRSLDRSERIVAAMKCRGFRGHFYLLDHFAFTRADAWFAAATVVLLATIALAEWIPFFFLNPKP